MPGWQQHHETLGNELLEEKSLGIFKNKLKSSVNSAVC